MSLRKTCLWLFCQCILFSNKDTNQTYPIMKYLGKFSRLKISGALWPVPGLVHAIAFLVIVVCSGNNKVAEDMTHILCIVCSQVSFLSSCCCYPTNHVLSEFLSAQLIAIIVWLSCPATSQTPVFSPQYTVLWAVSRRKTSQEFLQLKSS